MNQNEVDDASSEQTPSPSEPPRLVIDAWGISELYLSKFYVLSYQSQNASYEFDNVTGEHWRTKPGRKEVL
jgi:hypothetical protein